MDIERDRVQDPGVIISSLIECVSDLVVQLSEDLGDGALDIADKGEYTLGLFKKCIFEFWDPGHWEDCL